MKTLKYILIALLLSMNLTSCTPDSLEETDTLHTEVLSTEGDDGDLKEGGDL